MPPSRSSGYVLPSAEYRILAFLLQLWLLFGPLRFRRRTLGILGVHLGLLDRLDLLLATQGVVPLSPVLVVPLARDLPREIPIPETERQRHRQRNRAKQDGERGRDDVRRDTELLQRHEDGEQNDTAAPDARKRAPAMQRTSRRRNQSADEAAQHDSDENA